MKGIFFHSSIFHLVIPADRESWAQNKVFHSEFRKVGISIDLQHDGLAYFERVTN